ncbi:hypothetical protein R1sor_001886 [Riccia sorocarpa]|uniref:PIN domain-containing protein n=1 Tax=Riccia sorocarpa TaxID=122646 RepID=A0ABD3GZW6_9MARC
MGSAKTKKTRKFAQMKRMLTPKAVQTYKADVLNPNKKKDKTELPRNIPNVSSALFFKYNTALGPPYQVLIDTNFINFSIQNKLDLEKAMMDCLYAKCTPCITDCVMAELEKLGEKYRVALKIAKNPNFDRLPCTHKGTYADDCLVQRVTQHKCYIVATCDRDLKRRIRKIPGVPIMYITQHKYSIERLPEATLGGEIQIGLTSESLLKDVVLGSVADRKRHRESVGMLSKAEHYPRFSSDFCMKGWKFGKERSTSSPRFLFALFEILRYRNFAALSSFSSGA